MHSNRSCWNICHSVFVFLSGTCPKLDVPINGRKLGKSHSVGHEVHVLCDPGYELVGSESRFCQESLSWSGHQATCRGKRLALILCSLAGLHCLLLILFPPCLSSSSPWPSLILLSNPMITLTTLSSSFCNLALSCSLLPFLFLCIMHVTNVFLCRDTFHMWPMIIFPLYVLWLLSKELIECLDIWYSNLYVLWQLADFKITAQRLFDQEQG